MKLLKWPSLLVWFMLLMAPMAITLTSCDRPNQAQSDDTEDVEEPDRDLAFNNITLEQSDEDGTLIWRMIADTAIYSQDQQTATIDSPSGEFFQNDEPTLQIEADAGEVRNDGEQIFLKGNVVATDVESGAVVRGDELEWRTGENVVIIRKNVVGTHPEFTISANQARAYIDDQRVEVQGNVAALSEDEDLQLTGDELVWLLDEERLVSDRPIELTQFDGDEVSGRAKGDRAEFNLAEEVALLEENALVVLQDPAIRVDGDSLQWNLVDNTVLASEPLRVVHREENTTLTANQGEGNLDTQIFNFTGDVVVIAQRNQARLMSNELIWNIPTQEIEAEGDVVYRQTDPVFNLRGPRAEGKLENETIVVSGGRVVTEFIPETSN